MRRIAINNPSVETTYRTSLTADYASGTTLPVASNVSFAANDLIVLGNPREEYAELEQLSSLTGITTLTLASALNFSHSKNTPIFRVVWDFVSIEYRSSSSGTFAEITQSPIQWDNEDGLTIYFHCAGNDSAEYRFRFYNSATVTYSEYSPVLTGATPERNTVRFMIDEVRKIVDDLEGQIVSDAEIVRLLSRAQEIIYTHNPKYWFLYVDTYELGSGSIAATTNEDVYSLNSLTRFGHLDSIRYRYQSGNDHIIYRLREVSAPEFDRLDGDQNMTDDNWPQIYKRIPADASSSNGYFKITPDIKDSSIGTFYPNYYEKMADLAAVSDITQVPLPFLLEDYAIAYIEKIKGNESKARIYEESLVTSNPDRTPKGLAMLDELDAQQKRSVGQPQSLFRYRGQKGIRRLYGNKFVGMSMDRYREDYF